MKTTFKLSAVALALVANGAIAAAPTPAPTVTPPGWVSIMPVPVNLPRLRQPPPTFIYRPAPAPVVPAGDWTLGTAVDYRAISSEVSNTYGTTSDLAAAHAAGWKGQKQVLLTIITNNASLSSDDFNAAVHLAAPYANFYDYQHVTVANAPASYVAFNTSVAKFNAHNPLFNLNPAANIPGVMVKSDMPAVSGTPVTYIVGLRNATIANNILTVVSAPAAGDISFNGVNTGDTTKNAALTQEQKIAYISGSAAVIQSKFINLTNVETVRYMDSTTEAGRIFRLGNTLSPRVVR